MPPAPPACRQNSSDSAKFYNEQVIEQNIEQASSAAGIKITLPACAQAI